MFSPMVPLPGTILPDGTTPVWPIPFPGKSAPPLALAAQLVRALVLRGGPGHQRDALMVEQLPEDAEILEWWLVSPWLAEWLLRSGECVLEAYGFSWWGRQTSGQAIWMDAVIQEIACSFV